MAFNLTVSAITPPEGLPHSNRKAEIMELPSYLRVTGASGSSELKLIFVSATEPGADNIDNVWLKTDESGTAHGFYLHDSVTDAWLLMGGPGVVSGAYNDIPTDTNVLWLKIDATDAILTPGGVAVTAPQGLYKYSSTLWVCFTSTPIPAGTKEVYVQSSAPTGAADIIWAKTASEKGIWYYESGAWKNATAVGVVASGVGSNYVALSATPPAAAIRNFTLWGKTGAAPTGLFYCDSANGYWESINPISISLKYPSTGVATFGISPRFASIPSVAYSVICPGMTTHSAYFSPIALPMMIATIESDSDYNSGNLLNWQFRPASTTFGIGIYNGGSDGREIVFRLSAVGVMRIPLV